MDTALLTDDLFQAAEVDGVCGQVLQETIIPAEPDHRSDKSVVAEEVRTGELIVYRLESQCVVAARRLALRSHDMVIRLALECVHGEELVEGRRTSPTPMGKSVLVNAELGGESLSSTEETTNQARDREVC